MIDLLKFILSNIADHPEDIQIESNSDESGVQILTVTVHPEDMGKVIGKGGKIISAIRELVKVKAIKQGLRVRVILKDPDQTDQAAPSLPPEPLPQTS